MADITVPRVDFSPLSNLFTGYVAAREARRKSDQEDLLQETLANLPKGEDGKPDYGAATMALLRSGNTAAASAVANLGHQQSTEKLAQAQFAHTQYTSSPEYVRRVAQVKADVENQYSPKTVTLKTPDGNEVTVVKGPGGEFAVPKVAGLDAGGGNPYSYGKQNETQSKDAGYANRLFRAEQVLREPGVVGAATSLTQHGLGKIPVAGNYVVSDQYQRFDQAARDFVNAVLRRESGAAISQSEFDNAYKQYFPQPGDTREKILEKQRNRQATIASIAGGGGQNYRPPYVFGENGELIATGAGGQGVQKPQVAKVTTKDEANAAIADARAAIAAGADRGQVLQRLRAMGVNVAGI